MVSIIKVVAACGLCGAEYEAATETAAVDLARDCEATGLPRYAFQVGSLVETRDGWGPLVVVDYAVSSSGPWQHQPAYHIIYVSPQWSESEVRSALQQGDKRLMVEAGLRPVAPPPWPLSVYVHELLAVNLQQQCGWCGQLTDASIRCWKCHKPVCRNCQIRATGAPRHSACRPPR